MTTNWDANDSVAPSSCAFRWGIRNCRGQTLPHIRTQGWTATQRLQQSAASRQHNFTPAKHFCNYDSLLALGLTLLDSLSWLFATRVMRESRRTERSLPVCLSAFSLPRPTTSFTRNHPVAEDLEGSIDTLNAYEAMPGRLRRIVARYIALSQPAA
jgi:hypothetical protein